MSRDHRKLRVFVVADNLVTQIYRATRHFPLVERLGLQAQLRRAAVSTACNIVEGSARRSTKEYLHFLNIAGGSAAEARYLIELAHRLGLISANQCGTLVSRYTELLASLQALIYALGDKRTSLPQALSLEP